MKRLIISILFILGLAFSAAAQGSVTKDFRPVCDSLDVLMQKNRDIEVKLKLRNVMKRGNSLDFYFTESLGDFPWRKGEPEWFRNELRRLFPAKYKKYSIGEIYTKRIKFERLVTSELSFDGEPEASQYRIEKPIYESPLVKNLDKPEFGKGLSGRNIAVWHSHGRYFDNNRERWIWQRPCLFQTVEDMFTQSFVLPFLVPMLENAGAYVMLPRERDYQTHEIICDYDVVNEAYGVSKYEEKGKWTDAGPGFAAMKPIYTEEENPFTTGSARKIDCVMGDSKAKEAAVWTPYIPERGEYSVYISYKSLPESAKAVSYTVRHIGGESQFIVNQSIGGSTWIYLGTFEFDKGDGGYVSLSNATPIGYSHEGGKVVTADAVRFGGGMGNIARVAPGSDDEEPVVSGMPRAAEGARYWLQWAGVDKEIFSQNELKQDYRDDFMSRGDWVEWLSRGSKMNTSAPEGQKMENGKKIPIDLALGFHSDAGITPNDSIVGTLAIYTLQSEGKERFSTGESRMSSREYADLVQSQIVNDLRCEYDSLWSRRGIWDRGYRESRTPSCPSMLLELLSHQNFSDMKYGLDPTFRFSVSRAIYKGMLKYLSNRYGVPYVVQPLPVSELGVRFNGNETAVISWKETVDRIEPTAKASGFMLYTRVDDGGFDLGKKVEPVKDAGGKYSVQVPITAGHIYSFRIVALNEGGLSFPSETLSIGLPAKVASSNKVLIVNNFDRVSGPTFYDTPEYAGFDNRLDSGVPYKEDIAFVGEMTEYRRDAEYISNDNAGFGSSFDYYAGQKVAGNTFDYPYIHGKAMMEAGYPFYSCSNEAFGTDTGYAAGAWMVDLICGKQVTTLVGNSKKTKYEIFPTELQTALRGFAAEGGNILISGAHIATDVWDSIYPVEETDKTQTQEFVKEVLGYKWVRNSASRTGEVKIVKSRRMDTAAGEKFGFYNTVNPLKYSVEAPDGISPVSSKTGQVFLRYADTEFPAGVCFEGKGYRTVSLGFPIETLKNEEDIKNIISITLEFFNK